MNCALILIKRLMNKLYINNSQVIPDNQVILYNDNLEEDIVNQLNQAAINEAINNSIEYNSQLDNRYSENNQLDNNKHVDNKKRKKKRNNKCPICLEKIEENPVKCRNKKCKVNYHRSCINTWKNTKFPNKNLIPCIVCTLETVTVPRNTNMRNITNIGYPINRSVQNNRTRTRTRRHQYFDDSSANLNNQLNYRVNHYNRGINNIYSPYNHRPVTVY